MDIITILVVISTINIFGIDIICFVESSEDVATLKFEKDMVGVSSDSSFIAWCPALNCMSINLGESIS